MAEGLLCSDCRYRTPSGAGAPHERSPDVSQSVARVEAVLLSILITESSFLGNGHGMVYGSDPAVQRRHAPIQSQTYGNLLPT